MKKNITIITLFIFGLNLLNAQTTTLLDESLLTQTSFNKFTPVSVIGNQNWYFNSQYGAIISGFYGGQSNANEDWLISPVLDLSAVSNVKLSFEHARGPAGMVNVGLADGWYKVFATSNYTGNPATTNWIEITNVPQPEDYNTWTYIQTGDLSIPDNALSATTRFAFRYICSNTASAQWEVKNVRVTGINSSNQENVFKITNWNASWFGCTTFGPTDENLQLNNVVSAIKAMNSDIFCLQEITPTNTISSLNTIISLLGSDWGGNIVQSGTNDCDQNMGIIYKKSKVQFVSSSLISNGAAAQGYSYSYNWSSGRFPALYNVNLITQTATVPLSIVNIHAKAYADADSYTRRKGGSQGLKTVLDGTAYNSKNLILIGDFNDYLIGSTCSTCGDSPYKNFMDDSNNYSGITKDILNVASGYYGYPIIENIIISNEIFNKYIPNTASQEASLPQSINNYYNTTSDHLPVSAWFDFSNTSATDNIYSTNNLHIYPNPASYELKITNYDVNGNYEIIDLTGTQIVNGQWENGKSINVSSLPAGIYILKIDNWYGKFVKQ